MFPRLPERTRLFRLFTTHQDWTRAFLGAPTVLGVIDTYGIELIHPMREGRSPQQIGRKGLSNHRWIVGGKLCLLLDQCTTPQARQDILTDPALTLLADRLTTPLQIEHSLTRALEEGHKIGQKPLTPELIESVLARDLDDLEPRLTRHGYNVKALADLLHVRPTDIRAFLAGRLPPNRTQELQQELIAAGLPL